MKSNSIRILISLLSLLIICSYGFSQNIAVVPEKNNFQWPNNAKVAVCLTYDDGLDCHLDNAVPALDKYGFKGTFYCTGNSSSLQSRLEEWREIASKGHELGNHTLFHPCDAQRLDWVKPEYDINNYTMEQLKNELYTANTLLKAIDGKTERSFGYTCSDFFVKNRVSFIDSISDLFIAARSEGKIPENISDINPYFASSWFVLDPSGEELINYVKEACIKGTIAVFMFHSVGGGYLNVSDEAHEELLLFLSENKDEIWTDTFLNVMKYVKKNQE